MPAKAGIHTESAWTPAFAGVTQTNLRVDLALHLGDDLAGGVAQIVRRHDGEAGFGEPSGPAGWKTLPSWAVIATADLTIGVTGLRAMAGRAGATTVDVDASHVVMISQPQAVADVILTALAAVS